MSAGQTDAAELVPKKASEQPLNRACEACRVSKVRCLPNPNSTSNQCQRCSRAGRTCIFAAPAKRRQRKRTDVRVAELEKEVRQLTSLLKPSNSKSPIEEELSDNSMDEDDTVEDPDGRNSSQSTQSRKSPQEHPVSWTAPMPMHILNYGKPQPKDLLQPTEEDLIDRGVITKELAKELLDIYRDELGKQFISMVIDRDWTVDELRTRKPALFHAVMAAASHVKGSALSNKLHEEIIYFYARNIFIKAEKGLQWIQAIFVTISYWTPPANPAQLQIFSYASIAASMALEIGLTSKPRTHEQLPKRSIKSFQKISTADELLENCRTILMLYILTAGFSIRFRRPYILIFNSWMEECLHMLSKSTELEDRRVVAWLRLQRIADEAYTAFGFDDASTSFTLSEFRLRTILKIFERRIREWKDTVPEDVWTAALMVEYNTTMMSMWEFAMDGGRYDAPEFRNRHLTLPALDDDSVQPESHLSRSSLQVNATAMCISCAQAVLDTTIQMSPFALQRTPGVVFARTVYALVVLLRADYAIGTDPDGMGEFLDSNTLKIDYYIDSFMKNIVEAVGPQQCKIPSHWVFIMEEKIKKWHTAHMEWRKEGKHLAQKKRATDSNASHQTTAASSAQASSDVPSSSSTKFTPPETPFARSSLSASTPASASFAASSAAVDATAATPSEGSQQQHQQQQPTHQAPLQPVPSQLPLPDFNNVNTPWSWQNSHDFHHVASHYPSSRGQREIPSGSNSTTTTTTTNSNSNNNNNNNNTFATSADMMDFSTAFSNGDLYLWNESVDSFGAFGGWVPQTGNMFGDAQFSGGMGGQGF